MSTHFGDSLGQGNSRVLLLLLWLIFKIIIILIKVDIETKALQCLSTVCSILKYFGFVFIAVSNSKDKNIMITMVIIIINIVKII